VQDAKFLWEEDTTVMNSGMGPNFGFGPQTGCQFGPTNYATPGFSQPSYFPATNWGSGYGYAPPANAWMGPAAMGWGLGGVRTWGGTYSPQFLSTGLPTDREIVEMCYDAMDDDPVIPFDAEINVDSDAGTVTLTGTVHSKLVKHAAGDDAWWIPGVDDVHNELRVVAPQRGQSGETGRTAAQAKPSSTTPRATRTTTSTGTGTASRGATTGTRSRGATSGTTSRGATTGTARPTTPRSASAGTTKTSGTTSRSAATGTTGTTGTQSATRTAATGTKEKTVANARPTMPSTTGTGTANTTTTSNPTGRTGTRAASGTGRAGAA